MSELEFVRKSEDDAKPGHHVLGIHSAVIGQNVAFKPPVTEEANEETKAE